MRFAERPLAITDIETTGLDAAVHEILELAVLIVDQRSLKVRDQYVVRTKPVRIRTAAKRALEVVGYNPNAWRTAVDLEPALAIYSQKAADAIFVSYNVHLAYSFLDAGFKLTGIEDPTDYHRLDLFSLAWSRRGPGPANLDSICKRLNIVPEPTPHRAMDGALKQLEVLRALLYR
jgi:DNA polymerase III alpha subunit (gram-positive type)